MGIGCLSGWIIICIGYDGRIEVGCPGLREEEQVCYSDVWSSDALDGEREGNKSTVSDVWCDDEYEMKI